MDGADPLDLLRSVQLQYGAFAICFAIIIVDAILAVLRLKSDFKQHKESLANDKANRAMMESLQVAIGRNAQVLEAVLDKEQECHRALSGVQYSLSAAARELKLHSCPIGEILADHDRVEYAPASPVPSPHPA